MAEEYFGFLAVTSAVSSSQVDRHASTFSADVSFLFSLLSLPLNLLFLPKTETFFFFFFFAFLHNLLRFITRLHSLDKSRDSEVRPPLSSPPPPPPLPPSLRTPAPAKLFLA